MKDKIVTGAINAATITWFIGFVIFTPIYNYLYVANHGFFSWLFLGQIVPTLQAALWPIWVLIGLFRAS